MYVGILQAAGLAKEVTVGTLVTPPTEFLPLIAPDSFSEAIEVLESKGIRAQPDAVIKVLQGPASLKNGKIKLELEPENCGNILMGAFGTDSLAETASFVVASGVNDKIDFKEDGGSQLHATLTAGTYIAGTTSATAGTLCALIKTDLQSAGTGTYTVTYSDTTKKFTIAAGGAVTNIQILWLTGTNQATNARTLLGFSHTDTSSATSVTSDSTSQAPVFTHTFTRASVAQLPTYSWWFHKGAKYFQFTGCMVNKIVMDVKAKEMVMLDSEWVALTYNDAGSSQSPTYSALHAFKFDQAVVTVDGSGVTDYENLQFTIDNMVEADHALASTIYPAKIYSKGMRVTLSGVLYLENTTQWQKFLAGTAAHFNVTLTSAEIIGGVTPYSLAINIPVANYLTSVLNIENGILKVNFTAVAVYSSSSSYSIQAALTNSVTSSY